MYTVISLLREDFSEWVVTRHISQVSFQHPAGAVLIIESGSGEILSCNNLYPGPVERFFLRRAVGICLSRRIQTRHADLLLEAAERE
jgi:hypothetical protein